MDEQRLQVGFFLFLLGGVLVLTTIMFLPYLSSLLLAVTLAIIFNGLHQKIATFFGSWRGAAALVTVLIVLLLVLIPLFILGNRLFQEARDLYVSTTYSNGNTNGIFADAAHNLERLVHRIAPEVSIDLKALVRQSAAWIAGNVGTLFSSVMKTIINLFLMLIVLFYMFRDGEKFRATIIQLSPLADQYDTEILYRLELAVNSVIKGSLMVSIIQGFLAGIGFAIFNVPNPVLLGSVAAIAALIPGVGTALVLTPVIIFLFVTGQTTFAIGLLVWSVCIVGLIDNFVGPIIIDRGLRVHPMIVLLAVLGGLGLFGPMGFIIGPMVISLLVALLHIYSTLIRHELTD